MRSVGLRRKQRQSAKGSSAGQSDAPVTVVFRAHTDSLSQAPFLYYPKNYGLSMPSAPDGFTEAVIELCVPSSSSSNSGDGGCGVPGSGSGNGSSSAGGKNTVAGNVTQRHGAAASEVTASVSSSCVDRGAFRVPTSYSLDVAGSPGTAHAGSLTGGEILMPDGHQTCPNAWPAAPTSMPGYDSWVCRAYCFGERDALHTNGAISVHQSLTNKSQFINDITKGKALARVVPTYDEVRDRFGISHVELSFEEQSISRADMFLVSEALRGYILYEGQEVRLCGFSMKVDEMLRSVTPTAPDVSPVNAHQFDSGTVAANANSSICNNVAKATLDSDAASKGGDVAWEATKANASQRPSVQQQHQQQSDEGTECRYRRVRCGLVTDTTLVNFRSLSAVHFIILEISKEMWNPTMDGRITLAWAVKTFLGEYLVQQIPKHKASPRIRIVMVGRLHPQYTIKGHVDIVHMMKIPRDYHAASLAEEVELQCDVLVRRVLQEVKESLGETAALGESHSSPQDQNPPAVSVADEAVSSLEAVNALTERDIFVHAKNTCTIETIGLVLEDCIEYNAERNTDYIISVVSAGKGIYQVTNDLMQATCARLFNVGIEKVNIVCIGRPPLHATPLLEYVSEDETLRSQYHLHVHGRNRRFYERPEWARCYFYHPAPDVTSTGLLAFELLTKEEWLLRYHALRANSTGFVPGLGLPVVPLSSVVLPVMEPRKVGHVFTTSATASDDDTHPSPTLPSTLQSQLGSVGGTRYSLLFSRASDVCAMLYPPPRVSAASTGHEDHVKGGSLDGMWRFDTTLSDEVIKRRTNRVQQQQQQQQSCRPFVAAAWYCLQGGDVGRHSRLGRDRLHEYIIRHCSEDTVEGQSGHVAVPLVAAGIIPCGMNILDGDLQSGYMILKLRIDSAVLPHARWSPELLSNTELWAMLMGAFSGEDDRLSVEEQEYFVSHFHAAEIFSSEYSSILKGGQTLILVSQRSNVSFLTSEKVVLGFRQACFVDTGDAQPSSTTIAHVQMRNSILFAIKPISPYRPVLATDVAASTSHNVSTEVLLRRRWQFAHPELSSSSSSYSSTRRSPWAALCHCKILPLYGMKSAYPRDSFFVVPTHQYAVSIHDSTQLLEYVLQRLHQQYQIVVVDPSLAGMRWPRDEPTQNARLEMSIGHQIHEIKIGETGQSMSVTRMLHRGMYSNALVTHMIQHSYLLLNYIGGGFGVRDVSMEIQIGEKLAFPWELLDSYIRERQHPGVFIPRSPNWSLHEGEACIAVLPDVFAAPPVSFAEFVKFIGYRFSVHLNLRIFMVWKEDDSELSVNIPDTMDWPDIQPLRRVVLSHDNPLTLERQCVLDHKTGSTLSLDAPAKDRMMSVDITLPETYNPRCHYYVRVSWLVCVVPIVKDWLGSFLANAARYRLRAVPIPSYNQTVKGDCFVPRYTVRASSNEEEPRFRRRLLSLLTSCTYQYFPDIPVMNRNCRLLHFSGLCYVTSHWEGELVVARWYENPMLRAGQPEHQQLLQEFLQAVDVVRNELLAF
ncbi:putative DNA-directed RNA polymerase III largest subunit [Trypanosoma grayi]|uniref:putative DNA-directed RNA polymerase III largest subunit n=1 Tax=Trypanosoma grayi TaxID=71804 RepID=UPI0004F4A1FA|nr:putative DNA-directed RNA polymerase III largest subunit [Trypanosoma grayi]KEG11762.1 putative DNA-directed RNA polymerase III largest subunit [Trypanosoma grayi]